ncbi:MAG: hypothetical protein M1822_008182 [Bathelium mastoideum]|nr:MAG: hypothetical protein M1822_008182 [Bathelium mastoideum]
MAASKSSVFRITGLPSPQSDDELKAALTDAIERFLSTEELLNIQIRTSIVPSCYNDEQEKVALVQFDGAIPEFLGKLSKNPLDDWQVEVDSNDLNFDRHFSGFTQLYRPVLGVPVNADVIAITGLDGHAYGSWRGKGNLRRMWLRDFLSKDLPCCRTLTYGYNSKLSSRGIDTIMDYSRELMEELGKIRITEEVRIHLPGPNNDSTRLMPAFQGEETSDFLCRTQLWRHNTCTLKAAQASEEDHPAILSVYRATYGMLLFAIPHRGLIIDDIQSVLAEHSNHPRNALLHQIRAKSDLLALQLDSFKNIIRDRKIISFYETKQTRQLQFDNESGSWERTGEPVTAVEVDSALLQLPDHLEEKIPLHADHSQIVKFNSRSDKGYTSALGKLKQFEQDAPSVVAARFGSSQARLLDPRLASPADSAMSGNTLLATFRRRKLQSQDLTDSPMHGLSETFDASMLPTDQEKKQQAYQALFESLTFLREGARIRNVSPALSSTCLWVFEQAEFLDWRHARRLPDHLGFLWLKGKPGSGKSTIMKTVYDQMKKENLHDAVIAYFFNARASNHLEKSSLGMYRSLIHQILIALPRLQGDFLEHFFAKIEQGDIKEWTANELQNYLVHITKSYDGRPLAIFVDALDEGQENDIRDMITFLQELGQIAVHHKTSLQICLSSRHYPHISIKHGIMLTLEGQPGHDNDIATYVSTRLKADDNSLTEELKIRICRKAAGVFLWVILVVQILNKLHDHGRVEAISQRLDEIPANMDDLFAEILTKDTENIPDSILLLQWILFAKRPLSPVELYLAVKTGSTSASLDESDDRLPSTRTINRFILSCSKGLTEVTKSKPPVVQFIHETVNHFLLQKNALAVLQPDLGKHLLAISHHELMQCCFQYLFSMGSKVHLDERHVWPLEKRATVSKDFPFLEYASSNLLIHAEAAARGGASESEFLKYLNEDTHGKFKQLVLIRDLFRDLFQMRPNTRWLAHTRLLHIVCEQNLFSLLMVMLADESVDVDALGGKCGNALQAACVNGHVQTVQMLMEAKASPSVKETEFQYAFFAALYSKDDRVVRLVQESVASIPIADLDKALFPNIDRGYTFGVKVLLDSGANVNALLLDEVSSTRPLIRAASRGYAQISRLLLRRGADIDLAADARSSNALQTACEQGHENIVKLLVKKGANVNVASGHYGDALQAACASGEEEIVKVLLQHDADINAQRGMYGSALQAAAACGHDRIVSLLLEKGAKATINEQSGMYGTALQAAAAKQYIQIVRSLLDAGADVNVRGGIFGTALRAAYTYENAACEPIINLLRDRGAIM